jgi:hypothetical protein
MSKSKIDRAKGQVYINGDASDEGIPVKRLIQENNRR